MNYVDSDMSNSTNTVVYFDWKTVIYKGQSPSNGKLSDFSFYIDSQKSAHRKFKK